MARDFISRTFKGPWRGIEERETYQTDAHCAFAYNVDFSRGNIEQRLGYTSIASLHTSAPVTSVGEGVDADGRPVVVTVEAHSTDYDVLLTITDLAGNDVVAQTNLTDTFGEPQDRKIRASVIGAVLDNGQRVTLITTPYNTYVYNPVEAPAAVRLANMAADPVKQFAASRYYFRSRPRGTMTTFDDGRWFYAGINPDTHFLMDGQVDNDQFPDTWMLPGNRTLKLGPRHILVSDVNDPVGVRIVLAVPPDEKVMGLVTYQELVTILTDRSIWVLTGPPDGGGQLVRVVAGIGCSSQGSAVVGGNMLYFQSFDGYYRFNGSSAEKISKPIDSIFGRSAAADLSLFAITDIIPMPSFRLIRSDLGLANGVHAQEHNQIWWFVRTHALPAPRQRTCIVYDYVHEAWSYYQFVNSLAGGVHIPGKGIHLAGGGKLARYGRTDYRDGSSYSTFVFITGRLMRDDDWTYQFRYIRPTLRTFGEASAQWFAQGDNYVWDQAVEDDYTASRDEVWDNLRLHPARQGSGTDNDYVTGDAAAGDDYTTMSGWWEQMLSAGIQSPSLRFAIFATSGVPAIVMSQFKLYAVPLHQQVQA